MTREMATVNEHNANIYPVRKGLSSVAGTDIASICTTVYIDHPLALSLIALLAAGGAVAAEKVAMNGPDG